MVCETLINKKLMYRLYAASRLTKICVLLLLILVKQMLDMASIESNKSSSFFLIGLSIWAIVEIVVYFVDQRREAVCILKQYDVKQFRPSHRCISAKIVPVNRFLLKRRQFHWFLLSLHPFVLLLIHSCCIFHSQMSGYLSRCQMLYFLIKDRFSYQPYDRRQQSICSMVIRCKLKIFFSWLISPLI